LTLPTSLEMTHYLRGGGNANTCRTARVALARTLLAQPSAPAPSPDTVATPDATWRCPRCGTPMTVGPILTTNQLAAVCLLFDTS
jgi:hypothetical protein